MQRRFSELWQRIVAQGKPDTEFRRLNPAYSEPHRFYHNINHINSCLTELDSLPDSVEFAIWYHDAVYDTKANDNEEQSASLSYNACIVAGLPSSFAEEVRDLIVATKHYKKPQGIDAQLLIDIDLSTLGKPSEEFDEYERNIRREYSWAPEDLFVKGRLAILQMFLDRDSLYMTEFFRKRYESVARENLKRAIAALK